MSLTSSNVSYKSCLFISIFSLEDVWRYLNLVLTGEGINTQFTIPSPPCLIWHKLFLFLLQVKFYTLQVLNFCSVLQTHFPTTIRSPHRVDALERPFSQKAEEHQHWDVPAAGQRGSAAETTRQENLTYLTRSRCRHWISSTLLSQSGVLQI